MIEKTISNPVSTSRRESKGSIKPKSRSGSVGSIKHTEKEKAVTPVAAVRGKPTLESQSPPAQKPKKRGGFLSFLNCCRAPENANSVELGDQAVPAKKAKVLQQKPGRQPTPVVKANASAGESSTGESKEVTEDMIGGPEYSELKPAAKPKMVTRSSKDKVVPTENPATPSTLIQPQEPTKEPPAPTESRDQPLPALPSSIVPPSQDMKNLESASMPQAAATVEPPQMIEPDESVAEQGTTINDRTPQQEQRDNDIAMVDAPPIAPAQEDTSNTTNELTQAQINLPPPPPRNGQDRSAQGSSAITPNEKQQWLLPPLQPQLKGRKCLVLDLDETLVHSSFKVRSRIPCKQSHLI